MAYFCDNCGEEFYELSTHTEHHPYGSGTAAETFYSSPCCDSGYNEGKTCPRCEEKHSDTNDSSFCPWCVDTVTSLWEDKTNQEKFAICVAYIKDVEWNLHSFLDAYGAALALDPINTTITKFAISYVLGDNLTDEFIEFLVQENQF